MSREPFANLVFQGDRFKKAMPVSALPELAAYQDLVLSVAKALFAQRNPKRKKLPKGFADSFRLLLERVEDGSAVPVLLRETTPADLALISKLGLDYFEEARAVVQQSIAAAAAGAELPDAISPDALMKFSAFGKTLEDDEAIVVAPPSSREGPRYSREVRRNLVLRFRDEYEEAVTLDGLVVGVSTEPTYGFEFRPFTRGPLTIRASKPLFDKAVKALSDEGVVSLTGTGIFDRRGVLTKVSEVSDMSLSEDNRRSGCPTPVEIQVGSLEHLAPGWFDADSPGFDPGDLSWTAGLFKGVLDSFDLPTPYVYPTPDGEVRAEWTVYPWEVTVVVDGRGKRSDVTVVELATGEFREKSFALSESGSESRMGRYLAQHFHGRFAV